MAGKWMVVLPLLVALNKVRLQPITEVDNVRTTRQLDLGECCPCPDSERLGRFRTTDGFESTIPRSNDCNCQTRADDAAASASILLPALRAIQPFVKQAEQKSDPKPLLQPEVGLASSVLETLRQATDEEYQDALARDAARSAVKLFESDLSVLDDTLMETPKSIVRIFLNPDDNIQEPSHVHETRCIHSPLQSIHNIEPLRMNRPTPIIEVFDTHKSKKKLKNNRLLHKNIYDMDNSIGASNIQERVVQPNIDKSESSSLISNPGLLDLFSRDNIMKSDASLEADDKSNAESTSINEKAKPNLSLKLRDLIDNLNITTRKERPRLPSIDLKKYFSTTIRPPLKLKPIEKQIYKTKPLQLKDILKLKDVELIPPNELVKNIINQKKSNSNNPNLKLRNDNCEDKEEYTPTIFNKGPNTFSKPSISEPVDAVEASPSNFNPISIIENSNDLTKNNNGIECIPSSVNSDTKTNVHKPIDFTSQESSDTSVAGSQEEIKQGAENGILNEDIFNEESELYENLNLPMEFDNSTFIENTQSTNNNEINQKVLDEPTVETSNNVLHTVEKNGGSLLTPESSVKNIPNCNTQEILQSSEANEQHETSFEEVPTEEDDHDILTFKDLSNRKEELQQLPSNINKNSNEFTYQDLQERSDSILSQSECDSFENMSKNDELKSEPVQIPNSLNATPNEDDSIDVQSGNLNSDTDKLVENSELKEESKICESNIPLNTMNDFVAGAKAFDSDSDDGNNEMAEEATGDVLSNLELTTERAGGINDIFQLNKHSNILNDLKSKLENLFTTTEKNPMNDVYRSNVEEDSVNESSNNNPVITKYDELQLMPHKLLRETPLPKIPGLNLNSFRNKLAVPKHLDKTINLEPAQNSRIGLLDTPARKEIQKEARQKNIQLKKPQSLGQMDNLFENNDLRSTLRNNAQNALRSPLALSRPFEDIFDPSSGLTTLSDRLRSHTENSLQNIKETLESGFKDTQTGFLSSNPISTQDLLEGISSRRDEFNEKLQAIHSDMNDRFNTFQQSVLDQLNAPSFRNSDTDEDSSNVRFRSNYNPLQSTRLEEFKPRTSKPHSKMFVPQRSNIPDGEILEKPFKSTKQPKTISRFSNTEIPDLKQNVENKRPGLAFEKNHFLSLTKQIPTDSEHDTKSFRKPISLLTTVKPPLIPRPNFFKTKIDLEPKLNTDTSNIRESKIQKIRPLNKISRTNVPSEQHDNSPFRTNILEKHHKMSREEMSHEDSATDSPLDKLKKTLLRKKQDEKFRNDFKVISSMVNKPSKMLNADDNTKQDSVVNHTKEGRLSNSQIRNQNTSKKHNIDDATLAAAENVERVQIVEPLKENVPYKCKLICYKDV